MGDFRVRQIIDASDRYKMYAHALDDIKTFEQLIKDDVFVKGDIHVGAEQELCLVNNAYQPSLSALDLLEKINDRHYTNELGLFNMEINLDPKRLKGNCFSAIELDLQSLIQIGENEADKIDQKIVLAGILPTISPRHLQFKYMTPIARYRTLSKVLYDIRGSEFEIYIQGVDELMASIDSVLFESCNTSFQLHLQIDADKFTRKFNWSQMIAGPVLGACVNSPLLFGRELWHESRIAVFKQSLDTRSSKNHIRKKVPRVYFGDDWLKGSPINLWKNELMRFPLLLTSDDLKYSSEIYRNGEIPELRAIRLHNGTTYTWNRLCYGPDKSPHIRIECRYLPAGPSLKDEIANFAYWIGLMKAVPDNWESMTPEISFKEVKDNFMRSARTGLDSVMTWKGKKIPLKNLTLDYLLPLAHEGLIKSGIDSKDADYYLNIIDQRVSKNCTGSEWTIQNYRTLSKKYGTAVASQELVAQMIEHQAENIPISEWSNNKAGIVVGQINNKQIRPMVEHLMCNEVVSINENSSLDLAEFILKTKSIHHLPVENYEGELVGIITDGMLMRLRATDKNLRYVNEIMKTEYISVEQTETIENLIALLKAHNFFGLPVTYEKKLVGIITLTDLKKAGYSDNNLNPNII